MAFIDSCRSTSPSLERLEEFSTYNSCIKCFGKSIIPPLLTPEQREEACRFRAAATKLGENNEKKNTLSCASDEEHLASCNKSDLVIGNEFENQNGALLPTNVIDVQAYPTNTESSFSNEMHISKCKITSGNICSTVHKDVIMFPSVIQANNDTECLSKGDTIIPNCYSDQNASDNVDSYEDSNQQDLFSIVSPMPCKSASPNNAEYLCKSDTRCSHSVNKNQNEAQLSLRNRDSCADSNQKNLLYSVPTMPYIIAPTNDLGYLHESDAKYSQDQIQPSNNTSSYEYSKKQDLPYVLSSMSCVSDPTQEMPTLSAPSSGTEYLSESNTKCPSHSDQGEAQFSLDGTDSREESNKQNVSSFVSAMPYASGPTKEILCVRGPTVEMPYGSGPNIDMPYRSGPTMEMPYEIYPNEEMASVSEDEHDSNTESLEFGSLPTVISAGQFALPQDTDNESNVTCLTQSTDLEKYMDSSIEYSSPDDARTLSRSQISSRLNMSTRSDDGSSETLINTESESTPCASAMAILSYADSDVADNFSEKLVNNAVVSYRAHSVDSYVLKTCPLKLTIRKSQSEPSYTESKQLPTDINLESVILDLKNPGQNAARDSHKGINPVSESEVFLSFADAKKSLKRKHVRSNSYTLEHPSPALIMAHADCNCSKDSNNLSPHSCSPDKITVSTPNLAFKKEKVSIVLPPMQDRDKYFPILCSTSIIVNKTNSNTIVDTKISKVTDQPEVKLPEAGYENSHCDNIISESVESSSIGENQVQNSHQGETISKSTENSSIVENQVQNSHRDKSISQNAENSSIGENQVQNSHHDETISKSSENSSMGENQSQSSTENSSNKPFEVPSEMNNSDASTQRLSQQKELMNASPVNKSELKNNDINELLNQVIRDMKELQKNRVSQFFEEQNKLWLQMQEEFKEQERLLCDKLNAVNISPASDGVPSLPNVNNMNGKLHTVPDNYMAVTNSNTISSLNRNLIEGDKSLDLKASHEESSEVKSLKKSHVNSILNATTSPNLKNTELPDENKHDSQSTTSKTNTIEKSETTPLPPNRSSSLSVLNGDLPADSCDGSLSLQLSMSSRSMNNYSTQRQDTSSDKQGSLHSRMSSKSLNTESPDMLSDKQESIHSRMSSKSLNTESQCMSSDNQESIHSRMSSKSLNTESQDLSDKQETIHSSISETSIDVDSKASADSMQSLYNNCPISLLSMPESSYSSMSLRSSSGLSQSSDVAKMFQDFRFAKENNYPSCSSSSLGKVCHRQEHRGCESVCSECCSCLKSNSYARRLYFDNLSDNGNRHFTTPISPAEFIPSPAVFQLKKSLTSTTLNALQYQNPDIAATNVKNNKSLDLGSLDLDSSETTNSDQEHLSNNNIVPNVSQNLNNVPDINTQDDKSYSEEEIRAINDLVQSSYTSSYPCHLNEKSRKALIPSNNLNKKPIHEQKSHSSFHIPFDAIPSVEKGALKQNISSSLTNLKRRQSRDILKDPVLLKKFEKLPAMVKGYLTRRLFNSERVQDLIRTLRDTALLVGKCSQELNLKGNSVSENDVKFHKQLISQLMRTFENVYDILCTMSIGEQMKIISESRNLRLKKKAAEKKGSAVFLIAENCRSSPSKKPKLSSATIKALERKRSSIHSRTYLVEDLKGKKSRVNSNTTTKSHSFSPSRIYKSSVGTSLRRKTTSVCKNSPWK